MPPLSWNEIKSRAVTFSRDWAEAASEDAEAKTFWNEFFQIFGISRRRVGNFEQRVKKLDGRDGYIDLLWKGMLLIEHKSRGKDLDRAHEQALGYFPGAQGARAAALHPCFRLCPLPALRSGGGQPP